MASPDSFPGFPGTYPEGFQKINDLPMATEAIASQRIRAACDEQGLNYDLVVNELKDDLEDIGEYRLTDQGLRFVIKTLKLMRKWQ